MTQESCYQYWSTSDVLDFGEYFVKTNSENVRSGYIERIINVSLKDTSSWNVVQFQVTDWPKDGCVRKPQTILQVIEEVIRRQQKIGGGPIVVHCR